MPHHKKNILSVIICTCNRSESLKDTLQSLLRIEKDESFDYEILVVDNNSNDKTFEVVKEYQVQFREKLKYVFEVNQGKCFALNHGIKEARGEIIVFTDDDCLPENNWLKLINKEFYADQNITGILGGAFWENGKTLYPENDLLRGNGLNMSFRRAIFDEIGYFDVYLGPGSVGHSADDVEFVYRALKRKKNIVIRNDILIIHKDRNSKDEEILFNNRDCKGYVIFLLKYILKEHDLYCFKRLYWAIRYVFSEVFLAILKKPNKSLKKAYMQFSGTLSGLVKGLYIWLVLPSMRGQQVKANKKANDL